MATLQIIGLALLVGGVLGYGALFLWVLTNDKWRERREAKYDAKKVHPTNGGDVPDLPRKCRSIQSAMR